MGYEPIVLAPTERVTKHHYSMAKTSLGIGAVSGGLFTLIQVASEQPSPLLSAMSATVAAIGLAGGASTALGAYMNAKVTVTIDKNAKTITYTSEMGEKQYRYDSIDSVYVRETYDDIGMLIVKGRFEGKKNLQTLVASILENPEDVKKKILEK